ncbi:phosphotransferase [Sinomonas humi]|uniref:phosphotransferase n=1 Tax=Sinomonas humi TaxID=1338436 RepID=UPI0018CE865A|nr:phosphotransferase [Sinomonas humi]
MIVSSKRQARWRPCWFLTVRLGDGSMKDLYLRTQREGGMPWTSKITVEREYRMMAVLQNHGVKIPHVFGFHPQPQAILMETVPGRDRFDERDGQAVRDQVIQEYVEILAHAHSIDAREFVDAGLHRPENGEEVGYGGFRLTEKWYRAAKTAPDPINEFIVKWIHEHLPTHRTEVCWNVWDAGQFLHENGHCTAMMDVEFAMLGDPFNDLAAMRFRDTIQPIGNLTRAFKRYQEVTGVSLERKTINFQVVRFSAVTTLLPIGPLNDPPADFDYAQWAAWQLVAMFVAIEIMAEELGIDLTYDEPPPAPAPSRQKPWKQSVSRIVDSLVDNDQIPLEEFDRYTLSIAGDMTRAVLEADEMANQLESDDIADVARLIGRQPKDWSHADELLEEFVLNAGPEKEEELVRYFYRRLCRQRASLRPSMREMQEFTVQRIDWAELGLE